MFHHVTVQKLKKQTRYIMGNIVIKINTDNAAFSEFEWQKSMEVARILRQLSTDIESSDTVENTKIKDVNGNTVGEVYEELETE